MHLKLLLLMLGAQTAWASEREFQVVVDAAQAPDMAGHGERAKALCEEWYPKINTILYGPDHALPYPEVRIVIEAKEPKSIIKDGKKGFVVATSFGGVIHLHAPWLAGNPKDFDTVLIHELTHVNTNNYALVLRCDGWRALPCFFKIRFSHPNRGVDWLEEAIGDYIAFAVFTKRLEPRLRMNKDGYLSGYDDSIPFLHGLEQANIRIGSKSYRLSYSVAAAFLLWLEETKDREIVRKLNVAMTALRASPRLIRQLCGAPVDRLWREFLAQHTMGKSKY